MLYDVANDAGQLARSIVKEIVSLRVFLDENGESSRTVLNEH